MCSTSISNLVPHYTILYFVRWNSSIKEALSNGKQLYNNTFTISCCIAVIPVRWRPCGRPGRRCCARGHQGTQGCAQPGGKKTEVSNSWKEKAAEKIEYHQDFCPITPTKRWYLNTCTLQARRQVKWHVTMKLIFENFY